MAVLAVGSVALDTIETISGNVEGVLGGSAAYFSWAASYFVPVNLVGVVGADFPQEYIEAFKSRGIDVSGLKISEGKTFRWGGRYKDDFNERETIFTHLNAFADYHPELPASFCSSECVFLANIEPELQLEVLRQMKEARLIVGDTMDLWIHNNRQKLDEVLSRLDILLVNSSEACQLTGKRNVVEAGRFLHAGGIRIVVVKKGEHGSLLFTEEGVFPISAYPIDVVVDPTGCGDTFAGAFLGALIEREGKLTTRNLGRASAYGNVAASFCVEGFGLDRLRTVSREEIDKRFMDFVKMSNVLIEEGA